MSVTLSRRALLVVLAGSPASLWAQAAMPAEVAAELPGSRLLGSGRLTFLGLLIYDARLWVGEGFKAEAYEQAPLAIELEYGRTLYGKLIAERSLDEMKRGGGVSDDQAERWLATLKQTFPDVVKVDRITGLLPSPGAFRAAAAKAGLEVINELDFGLDYAETLRRWREAFVSQDGPVRQLGFDSRFMRIWEFYLAYCEAAFATGNTSVMQFTLQRD